MSNNLFCIKNFVSPCICKKNKKLIFFVRLWTTCPTIIPIFGKTNRDIDILCMSFIAVNFMSNNLFHIKKTSKDLAFVRKMQNNKIIFCPHRDNMLFNFNLHFWKNESRYQNFLNEGFYSKFYDQQFVLYKKFQKTLYLSDKGKITKWY